MNANGNSFAIFPFRLRLKAELGIEWNVLENCERHKLCSLSLPSKFYFSFRIFGGGNALRPTFRYSRALCRIFFIISDGKLLF